MNSIVKRVIVAVIVGVIMGLINTRCVKAYTITEDIPSNTTGTVDILTGDNVPIFDVSTGNETPMAYSGDIEFTHWNRLQVFDSQYTTHHFYLLQNKNNPNSYAFGTIPTYEAYQYNNNLEITKMFMNVHVPNGWSYAYATSLDGRQVFMVFEDEQPTISYNQQNTNITVTANSETYYYYFYNIGATPYLQTAYHWTKIHLDPNEYYTSPTQYPIKNIYQGGVEQLYLDSEWTYFSNALLTWDTYNGIAVYEPRELEPVNYSVDIVTIPNGSDSSDDDKKVGSVELAVNFLPHEDIDFENYDYTLNYGLQDFPDENEGYLQSLLESDNGIMTYKAEENGYYCGRIVRRDNGHTVVEKCIEITEIGEPMVLPVNNNKTNTFFDVMLNKVKYGGPVTEALFIPIYFLNGLRNTFTSSCNAIQFGSLFGKSFSMPCIELHDIVGTDLARLIGIIGALCIYYNWVLLISEQYNKFMKLQEVDDAVSNHNGGTAKDLAYKLR